MKVRWETAMGRRAGLAALVALAVALGGCSTVSDEDACREKGLTEGTSAFSNCVAAREARRSRPTYRIGGAGAGR